MHLITDNWLTFVVRFALGVFLAFFLAAIAYLIAWMIVLSTFEPTPSTILVMATSGIGAGAGMGSSLGWINPDSPKSHILLTMSIAVLAAIGGAWGGMYYGRTVFIMGGMPGIAELSGIVRGAVIGGNIPSIVIGIIRILRSGD